jgi:hypothetical protein
MGNVLRKDNEATKPVIMTTKSYHWNVRLKGAGGSSVNISVTTRLQQQQNVFTYDISDDTVTTTKNIFTYDIALS